MIFFLTTRSNEYTIESYLRAYGASVAGTLWPMRYEQLLRTGRLPDGAYVFADLELLSDDERARAAARWQELADRGCRLLNHPTRSLRRFGLLRALHASGRNRFAVHRLTDAASVERYPVFLRAENDHLGSLSPLLHGPDELGAAVEGLRRGGARLDETIIVEFDDTADAAGIYRKYAAFIVGDRIIARHLFFSDEWHVKSWKLMSDDYLREELAYVERNPHAAALREIFAAAAIDYGRIDYGVTPNGGIAVWEINTNPTIVWPATERRVREEVHATFAAMLAPAWRALDPTPAGGGRRLVRAGMWRLRAAARSGMRRLAEGRLRRDR